ncbi:MAG: extracellular solute-binding protein [Alphaproteobacteria bacterium]|nr:extracellular solute-binding protein [Alphaproteobacteria bacterium]
MSTFPVTMEGRKIVRFLAAALLVLLSIPALAQTPSHGVSMSGALQLPAGFAHFPYVNPDAPKGGEISLGTVGTFDSFNGFVLRGVAAGEIGRIYDTLLRDSADEASTAYGHIASSLTLAADRRAVTFALRPEARFHDGRPITAEDVAWTFNTLREQGRPQYKQYYADITAVTVTSPTTVTFTFRTAENRELPLILGQLVVLPKHWWAGRDFSRGLTEAPLGSGPYRLESFELGRSTVMARVPNYWARDLGTSKGMYNFERIRTEYYRDSTVAMQAFKAGKIDFRRENISKNWATAYDFPAVEKGLVKKEIFRHRLPTGMQGWMMNTRRPMFADPRVRRAMAEVFDFEWTNRNLFFGAYTRTQSYFSNSPLAATGLPEGAEKTLLERYRGKIPDSVFTETFRLPVTDGSGNNRDGLRAALALLKQAGWDVKERKLVDAQGRQMSFEILVDDPSFERIATPYSQWLQRLGADVRVRTVDAAQYQRLTDAFDFDMTMMVIPQSEFPGNEQREYFSCDSAKADGSNNVAGVCSPAIDALIDLVVNAPDREAQITATRALDRVLLHGWYAVPNWHLGAIWGAFWDRFGYPKIPIRTGLAFDTWWVDPARAAVADAARMAN